MPTIFFLKKISEEDEDPDRVTAILANDAYLFIGTGSGTVLIYKTLKMRKSTLPISEIFSHFVCFPISFH